MKEKCEKMGAGDVLPCQTSSWYTAQVFLIGTSTVARLIGGETRALEITRRILNDNMFKVEGKA